MVAEDSAAVAVDVGAETRASKVRSRQSAATKTSNAKIA
jgi:hypothetical protein